MTCKCRWNWHPSFAILETERRKVPPKWADNKVDGKRCSKLKIPDSGGQFQTRAAACHTQSVLHHKLPFWSVLSKWRLTVWIRTPHLIWPCQGSSGFPQVSSIAFTSCSNLPVLALQRKPLPGDWVLPPFSPQHWHWQCQL